MGTLPNLGSVQLPTRVRFGVLGFACSLSFVTYLDRICIMRAKENMQGDLGFSDIEIGWIFSAFTLGYALSEVPGGWMGDRWGARRVLTRIVLCWSLFTALTGAVWNFSLDLGPIVLNSLAALLLIRFFFGVGEAGAYPNLTRVVRIWFPFRARASVQGLIWTCARLGGAFAPYVLGRMSVALGWRQAFWVLGVIGVAWSVVFWWWFRDTPREQAACNEAERDLIGHHSEETAESEVRWPPLRPLVFSLTFWCLCAAPMFFCFGWYFYPTWQPQYLQVVHGINYEESELLTGAPFVCGAIGSLIGGSLSDVLVRRTGSRRWGRSMLGIVGYAAAGLCVLLSGFAVNAWQAVALLCLAFFFNDLGGPAIWSVCADIGGPYVGTLSGIMNMSGGVGAILSPILIPRVLVMLPAAYSAPQRWQIIFAGLAVSWFLASLAWIFIDAGKPLFEGVRGQKSEVSSQKSEVRGQKSEVSEDT